MKPCANFSKKIDKFLQMDNLRNPYLSIWNRNAELSERSVNQCINTAVNNFVWANNVCKICLKKQTTNYYELINDPLINLKHWGRNFQLS